MLPSQWATTMAPPPQPRVEVAKMKSKSKVAQKSTTTTTTTWSGLVFLRGMSTVPNEHGRSEVEEFDHVNTILTRW